MKPLIEVSIVLKDMFLVLELQAIPIFWGLF